MNFQGKKKTKTKKQQQQQQQNPQKSPTRNKKTLYRKLTSVWRRWILSRIFVFVAVHSMVSDGPQGPSVGLQVFLHMVYLL